MLQVLAAIICARLSVLRCRQLVRAAWFRSQNKALHPTAKSAIQFVRYSEFIAALLAAGELSVLPKRAAWLNWLCGVAVDAFVVLAKFARRLFGGRGAFVLVRRFGFGVASIPVLTRLLVSAS